MKTTDSSWDRLMRIAGMAVSVLTIIACLAGIGGCWWLRGEVVGLMVRTDKLVRDGVELAHGGIDGAEQLVGEAREEVGKVEERIQQALARVEGPRIATQLVRRELREGLEPRLTKMREKVAPRHVDRDLGLCRRAGLRRVGS